MRERNYYEILGVPIDADSLAITRAYRELAKKFHPDLNPNDNVAEIRMKEVNGAYEVLGNAERRREYDFELGADRRIQEEAARTEAEHRAREATERKAREKSARREAENRAREKAVREETLERLARERAARKAQERRLTCESFGCSELSHLYCQTYSTMLCRSHAYGHSKQSNCLHHVTRFFFGCETCRGFGSTIRWEDDESYSSMLCAKCLGSGYDDAKITEAENEIQARKAQNTLSKRLKRSFRNAYRGSIEDTEKQGIDPVCGVAIYVSVRIFALAWFLFLLYGVCIGPLTGLPPF